VGLDRAFFQKQLGGDLCVALALRDEERDVALAGAECVKYARGFRVRRHCGEFTDQPTGDFGSDETLAVGDGVDRIDQHLGLGVFEQEAGRAVRTLWRRDLR
jgi:hypothetical protein